MPLDVQGAFVSQKINKIRWIPEEYVDTQCFITGSWDDDRNSIKVWTFESNQEEDEIEHPTALSEYFVSGDVTEIKICDKNVVAVSLSEGHVKLLEISLYEKQASIKEIANWNNLHKYGNSSCSCTALDTIDSDIVTVGEDGALNILDARQGSVRTSIPQSDECAINCVCFINHNEVVTGTARGEVRVWDVRGGGGAAWRGGAGSDAITCVAAEGARRRVAAGGAGGGVGAWETRGTPEPLLEAETGAAAAAELRWAAGGAALVGAVGGLLRWALGGGGGGTLVALPAPPHPLASFDLHVDKALCAADNEAIYLIKNFKC